MNKQRMRQLIDHIKLQREEAFEMADYLSEGVDHERLHYRGDETDRNYCGTTACIAGHALIMNAPDHLKSVQDLRDWLSADRRGFRGVGAWARDWLELDAEQSSMLFEPVHAWIDGLRYTQVTRAMAVRMLELCIEQGRIEPWMWLEAVRRPAVIERGT